MAINAALTKTSELEPVFDRPLLLVPEENVLSDLSEQTSRVHRWAKHGIGLPMFTVSGIEGVERASITSGQNSKSDPYWQIIARSEDADTHLLQGTIAESGNTWSLVRVDHQGCLRTEAIVSDEASKRTLASFVLRVANAVDLESAAFDMVLDKAEAKTQLDRQMAYTNKNPYRHLFTNPALNQALSSCSGVGFVSLSSYNPDRISEGPNIGSRDISDLPAHLFKLVTATDFKASVTASVTVEPIA